MVDEKLGEREAYVQLRHIAAELPIGITENRIQCPFCLGGRKRDRGFSITRVSETEARYCCHRATCGRSGRLAAWGFRLRQDYDSHSKISRQFSPRLYSGNTGELGSEWRSEILDYFGISTTETDWAGWCQDIDSKRLVCPIFSPISVLRGFETRASKRQLVEPTSGPKTISYRGLDEVWMGWYRRVKNGPVLLVEDIISALKASRHIQSASLMGSHVSLEHILEATEIAKDNPVFLALDKDATDKAYKFIADNKFIAPNFKACPLSKDLKFLSDSEIKAVFS